MLGMLLLLAFQLFSTALFSLRLRVTDTGFDTFIAWPVFFIKERLRQDLASALACLLACMLSVSALGCSR